MASTLTNLLYHVVFSTKNRIPLISADLQGPLSKYVGGILRNQGGKLLEVGGTADHIHILVRLPASRSVSDVLRAVKSDSSSWINKKRPRHRFAWQVGYGAFTVSQSQLGAVRRYLQTQEAHHRTRSFKDELVGLLEKHGVEYDERYLWS